MKSFDTFFSASPNHLLIMDEASTLMKYPSISAAAAAANNVLPQPGGPYSNMPLGQPKGNRSGLLVGYTIDSLIARFASSRPTTSAQDTSGFSFNKRSPKSVLDESATLAESSCVSKVSLGFCAFTWGMVLFSFRL